MAFSTPVGGAILQTLGAIGPAHAAVFLHRVGHFLSARPHAVSIESGRSQMALGGRGGHSGRGWLCLLGWTPALLLFNTQTENHQLQLNSSPACYSTHKPSTISYNSRKQTAPQDCVIQRTKPTLSAATQFQEADCTPGLCYTAHKANTVRCNSIPGSRLHPRTVLYSAQSQHCLLQLNSRKQTAPQDFVIQCTKPTLSAATQFQEADCTPGLCYTAHKANTVRCNSIPGSRLHPRTVLYSAQSQHCPLQLIPGSRLHPRTVLYSAQSQHCPLQLNSRKQTAPQDCVIQHTKPTMSATTQFQTACLSCRFWMHSTRSGSALV